MSWRGSLNNEHEEFCKCPACPGNSHRTYEEREKAAEARIVAWLKVTPRIGERLCHIDDSQLIARIAEAIERGEHKNEHK